MKLPFCGTHKESYGHARTRLTLHLFAQGLALAERTPAIAGRLRVLVDRTKE
jgi:hypothetical protein